MRIFENVFIERNHFNVIIQVAYDYGLRSFIALLKMAIDVKEDDSLEEIFAEIGEFKIYQILVIILLAIPSILSAGYSLEYVFASATLDYR